MGPAYIGGNEDYCSPDIAGVHPEPFRQEGPAGGESGAGGMVRRSEQGFVEEYCGGQASLCHREYRQCGTDRLQYKGNDYRLVVAVDFEKGIVWIKWIGTHKAYDKIDVTEVRYGD